LEAADGRHRKAMESQGESQAQLGAQKGPEEADRPDDQLEREGFSHDVSARIEARPLPCAGPRNV